MRLTADWTSQERNFNEICPAHRSISNESRKRKRNWWERWRTSRKSKTPNRDWKQDLFQIESVWFWCSRCFNIPISFLSTKHDLFFFYILVSKFEGWKGRHLHGRPPATLSLPTPLFTTIFSASYPLYLRQAGQKTHLSKQRTDVDSQLFDKTFYCYRPVSEYLIPFPPLPRITFN